ncbi:hypothetical protein BHM03_00021373 [Ensete ventricosum]|nr:hypothetical protein BHM03_00021373 [Ensete ventricosum]
MGKTKDYIGIKKRSLPDAEVQHSLKQEVCEQILQLEKRLLGQFKTRCALEKALGCSSSAVLYKETMPPSSQLEMLQDDDDSTQEASSEKEESGARFHQIREAYESICKEKSAGADVRLGHSSVSQRATRSARISPTEEGLARALRCSHSQPLAFPKARTHLRYKLCSSLDQGVNPRKMKHEEKLAFWINIHNALMMHVNILLWHIYVKLTIDLNHLNVMSMLFAQAYVEYGIPQNNVKKTSLLIKWLQSLLFPRLRNKAGDRWRGYAIEQQEPLLHFALCSGNHSDPAVRVYTPKRLYQQLEAAKEEFIRATVRIRKEHKIVMPKVVDMYAKDMKLSSEALLDMVHHHLCETLRKSMQGFPRARDSQIGGECNGRAWGTETLA